MDREHFWKIRSANYDKLFWVKDSRYLGLIVRLAKLRKTDIVLDIGCGTGAVTNKIRPFARHVVGIDISDAMLKKGRWQGISVVKWDISSALFVDNLFDKIVARMVFHHVLDDLAGVLSKCRRLLKKNGLIIVAEGLPPSDDKDVVDWYSRMFRVKENRRVFKTADLARYLTKSGFRDVRQTTYIMRGFSVRNWLKNSGVSKEAREKIMDMHLKASRKIKRLYGMRIAANDCLIDTKNIIVTGKR